MHRRRAVVDGELRDDAVRVGQQDRLRASTRALFMIGASDAIRSADYALVCEANAETLASAAAGS